MSNEQKPQQPQAIRVNVTHDESGRPRTSEIRVPLAHLYARDGGMDLPGGHNQVSNMRMGPDDKPGGEDRKHFLGEFIPAWDCVRLTHLPQGVKGPREVWLMPMHNFKRVVEADPTTR